MLLQMMFQIAKSVFPLKAEKILIANSGAEVQKATTVSQIMISGIHSFWARELAHFMSKSAQKIRITSQTITKNPLSNMKKKLTR